MVPLLAAEVSAHPLALAISYCTPLTFVTVHRWSGSPLGP